MTWRPHEDSSPDPELDALMDSANPEKFRGTLPTVERLTVFRDTVAERVHARIGDIAAIVGVVAAITTAADGLSFRKPLPYAALLVTVVALGWWRQGNLAMRSLGDQLAHA
ncbi:hypothetical protein ACWGI9_05875 [Streptomyces sp. NPDC054833]